MLVLTRRIDESVVINDDSHIEIKVLSIQGRQVKLGINAPQKVSIHREEVFKKIHSINSHDAVEDLNQHFQESTLRQDAVVNSLDSYTNPKKGKTCKPKLLSKLEMEAMTHA